MWNSGSFLNEKFRYRWREPLTQAELDHLAGYIEEMRGSFIEPAICLAPRGKSASEATQYSKADSVETVLRRFRELHSIGVREFGLTYDDLQNTEQHRLYGEDVERFGNDIGRAQVYFANQVWNGLQQIDPHARLTICILYYGQITSSADNHLRYYRALAEMDPDVTLYSSPTDPEAAQKMIQLTGRPHLVWDNFWSHLYGYHPAPKVVLPLLREPIDPPQIRGYTILPATPQAEDSSLVSWKTGADYMWAPDRYDPMESLARVLAKRR